MQGDNNREQTTKSSGLIGQRQERIAKAQKLRELGIDPYPAKSGRDTNAAEITHDYEKFEGKTVTVAGRIMSWREHGKIVFADLQDGSGTIQLYLRSDSYKAAERSNNQLLWEDFQLLDVGDYLDATGEVCKTKKGEISVAIDNLRFISKAIRPIPDSWRGIQDKEMKFRRRYLDLTLDKNSRDLFIRKSAFWKANREFLNERGFMEVETPILEHKTGGADARPFETHHNDLDQNLYMRISSELYQKRLIGGGFEKIYTLGPNFRNEGLSDEHLQEYYQIEWYWAYADYRDNMDLVREMFRHVARKVYGTTKFSTRGHTFDLEDDWQEVDYIEIIKEKLGIDIFTATETEMQAKLVESGVNLDGDLNRSRLIDNLWKVIRKTISGPAFLVNEPKFMSPLAKSKPDNQELTERFHVIIAGSELGNGYSEINDPIDQLARFTEQEDMREAGDDEAQMLDIDFIEMLEYGMPPVSGYGHSERVFWFLENVTAREGTLFPLLKEHYDDTTKKIYADAYRFESAEPTDTVDLASMPSIADAEELLEENVKDTYQKHHAKMVAVAMRDYADIIARMYPEEAETSPELFSPDLWYVTGLIHDWDFDFDPDNHPEGNIDRLTELGYPKLVTDAILGHKVSLGTTRDTRLAQALVAIDEMSGIFFAYNKFKSGYSNMNVKGVHKKYKDKSFAAKIDRSDIAIGLEELGIEIKDHIQNLIDIYSSAEKELGSL